MYIYLCLISALASQQSFLQQALTSTGKVAEGVESLSEELSSYSSSLDTSFSDLDNEIDSSLQVSAEIGATLFEGKSESLSIELDSLNKDINDIEVLLAVEYNFCEDFSTCSGCVMNSNCVWCTSLGLCLEGDSEGVYGFECESWEYEKCSFGSCKYYDTCVSCLATELCGWCERTNECIDDSGDCSKAFYYGVGSICPYSEDIIIDNGNEDDLITLDPLWEELAELREESAEITAIIEELAKDQEDMLGTASDAVEREISTVEINVDLANLVETVDLLKTQEIEDEEEYLTELATQTQEQVIAEVSEESNEDTEKILVSVDEEFTAINEYLGVVESDLGTSLDSLEESMTEISTFITEAVIEYEESLEAAEAAAEEEEEETSESEDS
ncbi:hypothetical protein SteCoe_23947 [Stentor coeruleus]|uniref:PSI domain-containing protein n=1 Tax=Stentor coeruleus TaxID=5963 RepID=A0A1R2BIU4_9CILI|nr:hypothetical protein SteCoe_23947 [Stentor coeruleus]